MIEYKVAKAIYILIVLLVFGSCENTKANKNAKMTVNDSLIYFIKNNDYKTSYSKTAIPVNLLDTLSKINGNPFQIGDSTEIKKISFSDVPMAEYKYTKKLHFILLSDTICLISYREGGIGTHDIIDYFNHKGSFIHKRYITNDNLDSKENVIKYLKKSTTVTLKM